MRRAGVDTAVPIFSSWAAYCGVLAPEDRKRKRLIADLSEALSVLFVASPRGIVDLRAVPGPWSEEDLLVSLKALTDTYPDLEESLVTGEGAENGDWPERFNRATGRPAWLARPKDISGYASPAEATLAGLLRVADDLTARTPILKRDKQLVTGLRDRAVALINEYF